MTKSISESDVEFPIRGKRVQIKFGMFDDKDSELMTFGDAIKKRLT